MIFYKDLIGKQMLGEDELSYYVVAKETGYGIAIEQESADHVVCDHIYFTEQKELAYRLAKLMAKGQVTLITMPEIIDDFVGQTA